MGRKGCKMGRKPKDQQQEQRLGRKGCKMGRKSKDQSRVWDWAGKPARWIGSPKTESRRWVMGMKDRCKMGRKPEEWQEGIEVEQENL